MAIKLTYCSDPFANDFGAKGYALLDVPNRPLSFYIQQLFSADEYEQFIFFLNGQEISIDTVVPDNSHIVFGPKSEGHDIVRLAAFAAMAAAIIVGMPHIASAIASTSWGAGSAVTFAGANLSLTGTLAVVASSAAMTTAGSMLINALLPPEIPSVDSINDSPAYLWGGAGDTSQEMIPIPVFFGRFKHGGNLIASRTVTKSYQNTEISVQDTIYLLYGLSANNLVEIEQVYFSNQEAQQYGADDISIYWRKTGVTKPIKAVTASESDGTQLFYDGGSTSPATENEVLFPNIIIEHYINQAIPTPEHRLEITSASATTDEMNPFNTNGMNFTLTEDITSTSTDVKVTAGENDATGYTSFPTTGFILVGNEYIKYSAWSRTNSTYTFTIDSRGDNPVNHSAGDACSFFSITSATSSYSAYTGNYGAGYDWQKTKYIQSPTWYTFTSTSDEIENMVLEIAYPGGLYRIKANGGYRYRWQTYEIKIEQLDNTLTVVADTLFTPPDDCGLVTLDSTTGLPSSGAKVRPTENSNFVNLELWTVRKQASAFIQEVSLLDVINAPSEFITSPSGVLISLDGDGYLPKGYYYRVSVRVHGHGCGSKDTSADDDLYFNTISSDDTENAGRDIYTANIYRIKEINYDECLNYPYVNLLAIAVQANSVVNGQLPQVTILGKYACKFYDAAYPGIDANDISTWPEAYEYGGIEYGKNPAYIALTMLWDTQWGLGVGNGDPSLFAQKVNIAKFIELGDYCLEAGDLDPRYTFNGGFDSFTEGLTAVLAVLKSANATLVFDGARFDVYWEKELTTSDFVQVFDSSTLLNFKASYIGSADLATGVSGTFMDEDNFFEKTTVQWIYPLSTENKESMSIDLRGITESERALWFLQYKLKKTNLLRRTFEFNIDTQALRSTLGDGCYVQTIAFNWADENNNIFGGRVTALDSATLQITLDKKINEPLTSAHILLHTSLDEVVEKSISAWDNTGDTTVVTVLDWAELDNLEVDDNFIIGIASLIDTKCVITDISITDDISAHVTCVEYAPEMFDNLTLYTINPVFNPEVTRADFTIRNLQYSSDQINKQITVSWNQPQVFSQDGCPYVLQGYLIYKKEADTGFYHLTQTTETSFTDSNVEYSTLYFYKVLPVFQGNGVQMTIPLSWCSYIDSNGDGHDDYGNDVLATGIKLFDTSPEYLNLPVIDEYIIAPNQTDPSTKDIAFYIQDPGNWLYKNNAQEGYNVWCRFNDTDDTADWLGPTSITLTADISAGASTITVSDTTGLTVPGLIIIGGNDLVYVSAVDTTTSTLTVGQTDTSRKFSVGQNHSAGETVYNAHKGFFPVVYFGFEENTEIIESSSQFKLENFYHAEYDPSTGDVTSTQATHDLSQLKLTDYAGRNPYMMTLGQNSVILTINEAINNIVTIKNSIDLVQTDWTINLAYWDRTGLENQIYGSFWAGTTYNPSPLQVDATGRIYFSLSGLGAHTNAWFGINRVFFRYPVETGGDANYGWTSYFAMVGV